MKKYITSCLFLSYVADCFAGYHYNSDDRNFGGIVWLKWDDFIDVLLTFIILASIVFIIYKISDATKKDGKETKTSNILSGIGCLFTPLLLILGMLCWQMILPFAIPIIIIIYIVKRKRSNG